MIPFRSPSPFPKLTKINLLAWRMGVGRNNLNTYNRNHIVLFTLNTFAADTWLNPWAVDCKLLRACLMSPCAVKTMASRPSSV